MRERNAHVPTNCPSAAGGAQRPACGQEAHVDTDFTPNRAVESINGVEAGELVVFDAESIQNIPGRGN